jgi:hypothetical protein
MASVMRSQRSSGTVMAVAMRERLAQCFRLGLKLFSLLRQCRSTPNFRHLSRRSETTRRARNGPEQMQQSLFPSLCLEASEAVAKESRLPDQTEQITPPRSVSALAPSLRAFHQSVSPSDRECDPVLAHALRGDRTQLRKRAWNIIDI